MRRVPIQHEASKNEHDIKCVESEI